MEPLSAISLASNILHFIHVTRELVSTTREIFDAGSKREHLELEIIARDLQNAADCIVPPKNIAPEAVNDNERASLNSLVVECKSIANELLTVLHKLRLKDGATKWDSLLQALKSEWKSTEIDALRVRLERIGSAVMSRFTAAQLDRLGTRLQELQNENRRLEITRSSDIAELGRRFENLFREVDTEKEDLTYMGSFAKAMGEVSSKGLDYSVEQVILEVLRFDRLEDRYSDISMAHRSTLRWLFGRGDDKHNGEPAATFAEWLASDDDLYWVSGKPASGKSTLMKFLCTDPQTKELLKAVPEAQAAASDQVVVQEEAVPEKPVIIAEYFFWNAGKNSLQKSQEGLMRSLLYQTLRKCPDLIQKLFPDVWRHFSAPDTTGGAVPDTGAATRIPRIPLNTPNLLRLLGELCSLLTEAETRICFFIDGLDEYEGNTEDVINLVGELRKLPKVKICVSSRPWNEFEDAFGKRGTARLDMQDFNAEDISAYIQDVFLHDDNFQELEDKETEGEALVAEIVNAAKGVFLWVVLVVRSFQAGLRNGDSIKLLQQRLRTLPKALNGLFDRMLFQDVDDFYRRQAAQMFFITLEAKEALPLIAYWFLEEPIPEERKPLTMQQTNKRLKNTGKRLVASCKGLLEPHYHTPDTRRDPLPSGILFYRKVDFHHRTVRDYLALPSTEALIRQWVPPGFNAHAAICRMLFCQIKTSPTDTEYGHSVLQLKDLFEHHSSMLARDDVVVVELQQQLQVFMETYSRPPPVVLDTTSVTESNATRSTSNGEGEIQTNAKLQVSAGRDASRKVSRSPFRRWRVKISEQQDCDEVR